MLDATHTAHLLAAACTARTAMDQVGQGRAVTGRLGGAVPIDDEHPAVVGSCAQDELTSDIVIVRDD